MSLQKPNAFNDLFTFILCLDLPSIFDPRSHHHRRRDLTGRLLTVSVNDSLDGFTDLHSLCTAFNNDVWVAVALERLCSTMSSLFLEVGEGQGKERH